MTTAWTALLLLGLAAAAPQTQVLTYEQAVASAIDLYNQQRPSEFAFRLLEAEPQPNWDPNSKTAQALKFSIKETVCPSSQTRNLTQCDFKDDGLDKDCSGIYSALEQPPIFNVQCEDINQKLQRITRIRWRRVARIAGRVALALIG
ncbi:cathelicidin-related peptide Oh-Cath-like [Ahaetulla prasina]|uniref:cathelicidin-related peptide Oh-Cath-like n=1 Tax=Ahaetulla prasina TaxID=499056 RepID=UPI00264A00E5|nr:cathelicidin-related peptide Oh-Cath-like [Ahaetulla prasina]